MAQELIRRVVGRPRRPRPVHRFGAMRVAEAPGGSRRARLPHTPRERFR